MGDARTTVIIVSAGAAMFLIGLVMFDSIEIGQTEPTLRMIKNTGTFVGLAGMGVVMAGIMLALMGRRGPIRS